MGEIPEDIMKATAQACADVGALAMGAPFVPSQACMAAMRAITAERERCAEVALHAPTMEPRGPMFGITRNEHYKIQSNVRMVISALISRGAA